MGAPQTLPANFSGWDSPPATLPKDFDKWDGPKAAAPGTSLNDLANAPNNAPLDSYAGATMHGLASIGQGVFQAANALRHPIDTAQGLYGAAKEVGSALAGNEQSADRVVSAVKKPFSDPLAFSDFAGNQAGQIVAGLGTDAALAKAPGVASSVSDALKSETAGKVAATAKVGVKTAARFADVASFERLGKVANALKSGAGQIKEIWKTPEVSLDNIADALAQTIADDRARVEINKSKGLGELPATGAKPASQTGEALATEPTRGPEPTGGKSAAPRFTQADRAAAQSLLQDALKQHSGDIIDAAIPPSGTTRGANLFTRTQVDAALKSGDVGQAEKVLDAAAKATNSSWTPLQRQIVPSVNEIRARVKAESPGSPQDILETRGIQETMREDLQKHGWAAESEARREFIARNSTGMTKGELGRRFAATSGKASPAAVPASDDLTDVLQKSLDAVRARSEQK